MYAYMDTLSSRTIKWQISIAIYCKAYHVSKTIDWKLPMISRERASIHVAKAIVNFYRDDSDSVFLRLSHDLRPNILKVYILICLMVGNVGLWPAKTFLWTRVTEDLRNGKPLETLSVAKQIKIKELLHQFTL